ncbi:MAG: sigma-70 family RNA polymerase sigma factor [Lentisphaeria bacterium]|nr:sigma-70 family RNA polymerase sigma factor [Lentisphaeria bacterium]
MTTHIDADTHPGLHRYSQELRKYPELTEEQYAAIIDDLKQPEGNDVYQAAREKLICSHLGMVLAMAVNTIHRYYGLSMEDFVGIGNQALVERFGNFNPDRGDRFASYMKKVIVRSEYASVKSHITWDRDEDVDPDSIGIVHVDDTSHLGQRMERALMTLSKDELRIIRMLFYSANAPDYTAVARTLHRTERGLRKTLDDIYAKLRPLLSDLRNGGDRMYITPKACEDEH